MKKWFVGLLMMAMALVMIPSVVMAETEVSFYCPSCCEQRTGIKSDTYEYFDQNTHIQRITCKVCNYKGMSVSSAHTETKAATCQSPAYCGDCQSNYGSKAGHNWSAWSKSDENQHVRTCQTSGCDAVEYAAHTGGGATCIKEGTCTDCGASYHTDHNWGAWTKADENQHVSTCSGCNQTQSGEHTGGNATCSTEGTCTVCYGSYKDSNNHTGPYTNAYAPSASSATQHTVTETCTGCGKISRFYGEDHQLEPHDAQAPTCTEIGWDAYETCSRCDYTTYVEKSALGHDRVSHDAKAPTCTEIGWDAYDTCSRCDYTTYVEKSALGHDRVSHDAKAPTCTEIGWDAYDTCSRCDYSTYVEKSELGHDRVSHDAKAPTCTAIGWEAYDTCSHCDYTTYVELPALGHDYQAKIIPRTCEDDGYTLHTCTRCADRYADTIVPHCGHWYGEWTANGDGTQRAECLRGGCHHEKTVDCEIIELPALNISLCPVCGTASDGSRLALTNASVKIVSGRIPHGEALLRVGTLANGEKLLTVGYVYGGQLSKASCQVKITLPAGLLEGHTLSLLAEDGTETELTDVQDGSFVLDFSGASSPVQVIRLVPQAE